MILAILIVGIIFLSFGLVVALVQAHFLKATQAAWRERAVYAERRLVDNITGRDTFVVYGDETDRPIYNWKD
jgi:hypothetical protein